MPQDSSTESGLGYYIQRALTRATSLRRTFQIGGVLVGVLIAGVSELASNALDGTPKVVFQTLWFVGLAMAFLAGGALAFFEQDTAEALELARAAAERESQLQAEIGTREAELESAGLHAEWLARLYSLSIAHRERNVLCTVGFRALLPSPTDSPLTFTTLSLRP